MFVFRLWCNAGDVDGDGSVAGFEVGAREWCDGPCSPCDGRGVDRPVELGVWIPHILYLERPGDGRTGFHIGPGETSGDIQFWLLRFVTVGRDVLGSVDLVASIKGKDDQLVGRDPNERSSPSGSDKSIAVEHALGAAKAV